MCCCGYDQALSHEVIELRDEKKRVYSGLVTSGDVGELVAEKKVNIQVTMLIVSHCAADSL